MSHINTHTNTDELLRIDMFKQNIENDDKDKAMEDL